MVLILICVIGLVGHIFGRSAASLLWKISHGYNVKYDGDPLVELAHKALRNFSDIISPGRFIADFLPICTYLGFPAPPQILEGH